MPDYYNFKILTDFHDLERPESVFNDKIMKLLGVKQELYPEVQNGMTLSCEAILDCYTLFDHRFEAKLTLLYTISDRDNFFKRGAHKNPAAVEKIVINFIKKVLAPVMSDYCWSYDLNHNLNTPLLYKVKREKGDISLEQSNYFSEVMDKVHEEAKKHPYSGCYITHTSLLPLDPRVWRNKQEEPMTARELELIRAKYGDKLINELVVLELAAAREKITQESQSGSFQPAANTIIEYKVEGDVLKIEWTNEEYDSIQVYKHDGAGYPKSEWTGTIVVHSNYTKGKEFIFNLPKGIPVYFSIVSNKAIKRKLSDTEHLKYSLGRFSVLIPEEQEKQKEESAFSEYEKKLKDEEDKIKFNNEVRLLKAKSKLEQIKRIQEMREEEKKREEKRFLNINNSRNINELQKDVSLRLNIILEEIDDMFNKMESQIRRDARV